MNNLNKEHFLNNFDNNANGIAVKLYEKILFASKINRIVYCDEFYTPDIWKFFDNKDSYLDCVILSEGIFEDSERRFLAIKPIINHDVIELPIKLIRIINKSKFSEIKHRDYLGALTSLGIKRELFGDLIVTKNSCYVPIINNMIEFIKINLQKVKNAPVSIEEVDLDKEIIPRYNFKQIKTLIASERCDSIISAAANISRSEAIKIINSGNVLINYKSVNKKNSIMQYGDVFTIRGYGKYKLHSCEGVTKKDRKKVIIYKFI